MTAEIGSTGSMDHIREEPNRSDSAYPTGYMGKNSEVAWIQRVAQQLAREASAEPSRILPAGPRSDKSHSEASGMSAKNYVDSIALATKNDDEYQFETPTYHLDDLSVSIAGGQINPFYLPPKETADELLNAFFSTVYPTFPIVLKKLFMAQYDAFFQSFFPPASSKRWLAMLNLMFAIGSMYGRLTNADWKEESEIEHLKYFARARVLSLDEGSILEVPDLQQVQVVGLAAIYLIASNQTNRYSAFLIPRVANSSSLFFASHITCYITFCLSNSSPKSTSVYTIHNNRSISSLPSANSLLTISS